MANKSCIAFHALRLIAASPARSNYHFLNKSYGSVRPLCVSASTEPMKAAEGMMKVDVPPSRPARQRKSVMSISDRAAARVAELMAKKDPPPLGLRLGVRTRGCNGLSYTMNYVDSVPKFDEVIDANGVKVFVDPKAVMYLVGSRMDFVEDAVKAEFVFENPNAKGSCGCGESFNV